MRHLMASKFIEWSEGQPTVGLSIKLFDDLELMELGSDGVGDLLGLWRVMVMMVMRR
jgi:hypothetical protein